MKSPIYFCIQSIDLQMVELDLLVLLADQFVLMRHQIDVFVVEILPSFQDVSQPPRCELANEFLHGLLLWICVADISDVGFGSSEQHMAQLVTFV